jgi:hypothetical protein
MAGLKQVASLEDILKDLLGHLPEHDGGQPGRSTFWTIE